MKGLLVRVSFILLLVLPAACSQPINVKGAHWESTLRNPNSPISGATYTAKSGYSFLVIDADISLGESSEILSEDFNLISDDGKSFPAVGMKLPTGDYMMGSIKVSLSKKFSGALIFSIPEEDKDRPLRLRFRDGSPTAFSVSKK